MTINQLNSKIINLYKDYIEKTKKYLENKYYLEICDSSDEDFPPNLLDKSWYVWKIKFEEDFQILSLIVAVPTSFPDTFPKIYLSKKDFLNFYPIPHVDKNRFVCTRNPNVVYINDDKPGEALDELIKIAVQEIILPGIKKENLSHFLDEFLAYWNQDVTNKIISLYKPSENYEELKLIPISKKFLESGYVLTKSEDLAEKWFSKLNITIKSESVKNIFYLPFSEPFSPFISIDDFCSLINKFAYNNCNCFKLYFSREYLDLMLIFSFPLDNKRLIAGLKLTHTDRNYDKGFTGRAQNMPLNIKLKRSKVEKLHIERIDEERIFNRRGIELKSFIKETSLAIIGCGSLGSHLAMSLSKSGISKFLLVDNEQLSPENVARHLCGFKEVEESLLKCDAVKKRIIEHFPHINCETYSSDILNLLLNNKLDFNNFNLIIDSTGNNTIARRLNYFVRNKIIKSPLIIIWIEPYGVAGQIFYLHPEKGGCFECCIDDKGFFLYSVASTCNVFNKRETGCQNTFIPYSNLNIECFSSVACRVIIKIIEDKPLDTELYTWLGDLRFFKEQGYKIRDEYIADSIYSIHKRIVSRESHCKICQKNLKI